MMEGELYSGERGARGDSNAGCSEPVGVFHYLVQQITYPVKVYKGCVYCHLRLLFNARRIRLPSDEEAQSIYILGSTTPPAEISVLDSNMAVDGVVTPTVVHYTNKARD